MSDRNVKVGRWQRLEWRAEPPSNLDVVGEMPTGKLRGALRGRDVPREQRVTIQRADAAEMLAGVRAWSATVGVHEGRDLAELTPAETYDLGRSDQRRAQGKTLEEARELAKELSKPAAPEQESEYKPEWEETDRTIAYEDVPSWINFKMKEQGSGGMTYTAGVKFDGCIHLTEYGSDGEASEYTHICDLDDFIEELKSLRKAIHGAYRGDWPG